MIRYKKYDYVNHLEEAWFDSSMIVYSKMVENQSENKGTLYVVFKNGTMYKYIDVDIVDYVLFIGGGTDASQGKTLNKLIKGKYDYEKCQDVNLDELEERMKGFMDEDCDKSNTYFIFGYEDITPNEFEMYYQSVIGSTASYNEDARFIVGDKDGLDIMAQNYLVELIAVDPARITVYHVGDEPKNLNEKIKNIRGGFKDDDAVNIAMTNASAHDIAFIRDEGESSFITRNILRRFKM